MDKREVPAELRAMMMALDAIHMANIGHTLDWHITYDAEYNKWEVYAKSGLTEITLEWRW